MSFDGLPFGAALLWTLTATIIPTLKSNVYIKLAVTSVAMFFLPLATYFSLMERVGTAWAGGAAATAANVVLVGYIVAAFLEDKEMGVQKHRHYDSDRDANEGRPNSEKNK